MSFNGADHLDKPEVIARFLDVVKSFSKVDTSKEVIARILDVVKSFPKVDPSKVTPDIHFQKYLRLDNLNIVKIVMVLEKEFKLGISDQEADQIDLYPLAME